MGEGVDLPGGLAAVPDDDASAAVVARRVAAQPVGFDAWVVAAGPHLMRFAQATARGLDPADLVQDALVAVFTRWSRLADPGQADAYARRVILNSHISRWRRWGRKVSPTPEPLIVEGAHGDEEAFDDVMAARQMLAGLPVTQRAAIFLRFYDDLTYREIADILRCREATARSHVHRALSQLKGQIEKDTP